MSDKHSGIISTRRKGREFESGNSQLLYVGNQVDSTGGTPTSLDVLAPLLKNDGFSVLTASAKKNKVLRMADMLFTVFRNRKSTDFVLIDTYSTQNFWYAWAVARLCQKLNLKYIPILHGGELPERLKRSPGASKVIFTNAYLNVAPSLYLKAAFQKYGFTNVRYTPNSINLKDYQFKEREQLRPKLLWVRAFADIYNPMLAIKSLEILRQEFPDAELCMVGPEKDASLQECRKYVSQYRLPVMFPGKLSKQNWIALSADYDIFLNTTNIDNTPVSVIEAMALGLPVVSTNVGGLPFLISADVDGLLVPPDNPERMARAVEKILRDSDRAMKISQAARKKVAAFDWEVVKHQWEEVLDK